MLTLTLSEFELFDEETNRFFSLGPASVRLEHSLASLSKWESFWETPYLGKTEKSNEQALHYLECMALDELPERFSQRLTQVHLNQVSEYIQKTMTATRFPDEQRKASNGESITAEVIYYWMVSLNIPLECEHWHLNRLLTLVRVCNVKNSPPKKMPMSKIASRNRDLNAKRRAMLGTSG